MSYTETFKEEAVCLISESGHPVTQVVGKGGGLQKFGQCARW